MDNLTHSLAGAVLGQMGLKKKTGLGMPTLIIAANIPDIDAIAVLWGGQTHLAIRRGITHGPIAMLVLPLILWGIMIWYDGWQEKRGRRPEKRLPLHKGWLLALAYIGTLSHPALDLLNSYGVRLLEPFSSRWFYGDVLFIIDIWVWIALGIGLFLSLRREKQEHVRWYRPAIISCVLVLSYISANMMISRHAVAKVKKEIAQTVDRKQIKQVVADMVPITFWKRRIILGDHNAYYDASYSLFDDRLVLDDSLPVEISKHAPPVENLAELGKENEDLKAFLFWTRMPVHGIVEEDGENYAIIMDARFKSALAEEYGGNRFKVKIKLKESTKLVSQD